MAKSTNDPFDAETGWFWPALDEALNAVKDKHPQYAWGALNDLSDELVKVVTERVDACS